MSENTLPAFDPIGDLLKACGDFFDSIFGNAIPPKKSGCGCGMK